MKTNPIVNDARAPRKPLYPFPRAANRDGGRGGRGVVKAITPKSAEAFQQEGIVGNCQNHPAEAIRLALERPGVGVPKDGSAGAAMQGDGSSMEGGPTKRQPDKRGHESFKTMNAFKSSPDWQDSCWTRWPKEESWPGILDLYEAAARVRMSPDTIRRATATGRDGRAKLAHRRIGTSYRFWLRDIDNYGIVLGR
jgi:hypothetical protein